MTNTGYQQAVIARKESTPENLPLDVDGNLCSVSGKKQAVLLLNGETNPDPNRYEVEGNFAAGAAVDGHDTRKYNLAVCPLPDPEPELPAYVKPTEQTMYLETAPIYQVLGNDWDTTWNFANGQPNKGTYPYIRIGEYEWMTKNVRMYPVAGRIWDAWRNSQENIDAYINAGGYDAMTLEQSVEYEGGFFGGSVGANEVDAFFASTAFYSDSTKATQLSGWQQPSVSDFAQLFAMADTLDFNGLIRFLAVESGNPKFPFNHDWQSISQNTSGFSAIPCGTRSNGGNGNKSYRLPRNSIGFKTVPDDGIIIRLEPEQGGFPLNVIADNNANLNAVYPNTSIKFYIMSVRYCRRLTNAELGYRLYSDPANDRVLVVPVANTQPTGLTELPKGKLRGRAVRWMNAAKTQVLAPLSLLQQELAATDNGGSAKWFDI